MPGGSLLFFSGVRIDSFQPLRHTAKPWMERRQQVNARHIPPEASFIQRWIDQVQNFLMRLGCCAPVKARGLVVNGMVTIVKQHQVDQAGEISRVTVFRFLIGVNVLNIVENQDTEE